MFFLLQTYFDINRYRGTNLWEPLRAGIQADMQRAYRERKYQIKNILKELVDIIMWKGQEDVHRLIGSPKLGTK